MCFFLVGVGVKLNRYSSWRHDCKYEHMATL